MRRAFGLLVLLAVLAAGGVLVGAAARDESALAAPAPPTPEGMMALESRTLTRRPVSDLPIPAAWTGFRVRLEPGEEIEHAHGFATVIAREGDHVLVTGDEERMLEPGSGASVQAAVTHVHRAPDGEASVFWEVVLAEPDARPTADGAERIFQSAPMRRIPTSPLAVVLSSTLPPERMTTVHTHPGPAFVRVTRGTIEFEGGIGGVRTLEAGSQTAQALAPHGTPVQKRNPSSEPATYLSFHLVRPGREFASSAEFGFVQRLTVRETSFDLSSPFVRDEPEMLTVRVPRPGTYVFRARNVAGVTHTLRIEGHGVETGTGDIAPGETSDLRVTLGEPGEYALYCDIPGHRGAGMDGRVVVGDGEPTAREREQQEAEDEGGDGGGGLYGP